MNSYYYLLLPLRTPTYHLLPKVDAPTDPKVRYAPVEAPPGEEFGDTGPNAPIALVAVLDPQVHHL